MRHGPTEQALVVCAVQIDVTRKRVETRPAIDAMLEPLKGENACQNQIVLARLPAPRLTGRLPRDEHGAGCGTLTNPRSYPVPSRRGAKGPLSAADPSARRGNGPCSGCHSIHQPDGKLAFGVDHEQPLGQFSWSAPAREAPAREIERANCKRWFG